METVIFRMKSIKFVICVTLLVISQAFSQSKPEGASYLKEAQVLAPYSKCWMPSIENTAGQSTTKIHGLLPNWTSWMSPTP
jgi:hypothetical protein